MSKHTPGPWDLLPLAACQAVQAGPDNRICHLPDHVEFDGSPCGSIESQDKTQDEIDANARLIAAAPELLEALQRIMHYANTGASVCDVNTSEQPEFIAAREAIAKATELTK